MSAAANDGIGQGPDRRPVPYSSGTEIPKLDAPRGACDCHMHIYDSRFPVAPTATLKPPDALVEDYRRLQQRLGTSRNVVVTPSTYGTDNRVTLEAVRKIGPSARAVAVVDTSVTDEALKRMAAQGVRGIRFNLVQAGANTVEMLEPLSRRADDLGLHVQLHMPGDRIVAIADLLQRLPATLVFDHMGRIPEPGGVTHPTFAVVRRLLDKGRTWVKLSGAYLISRRGPPGYEDVTEIARAYVRAAPERMVWASDWPHPSPKEKPDDAALFDLLGVWAPDEAVRHRILVENPAALYGFP